MYIEISYDCPVYESTNVNVIVIGYTFHSIQIYIYYFKSKLEINYKLHMVVGFHSKPHKVGGNIM